MLTLDYIKENTLWVVKFESGNRITDIYDKIKHYQEEDDVDDVDIVSWSHQPKDLQDFYKAYEYALYDLKRNELFIIDDFYNEWIKNPMQFTPEYRHPIGKLSQYLEDLNIYNDLIICNYYGHNGAGNHKVGNFIEALQILNIDFDVIDFEENISPGTHKIYIQSDDVDLLNEFGSKANSIAVSHDPILGDGKYSSKNNI